MNMIDYLVERKREILSSRQEEVVLNLHRTQTEIGLILKLVNLVPTRANNVISLSRVNPGRRVWSLTRIECSRRKRAAVNHESSKNLPHFLSRTRPSFSLFLFLYTHLKKPNQKTFKACCVLVFQSPQRRGPKFESPPVGQSCPSWNSTGIGIQTTSLLQKPTRDMR